MTIELMYHKKLNNNEKNKTLTSGRAARVGLDMALKRLANTIDRVYEVLDGRIRAPSPSSMKKNADFKNKKCRSRKQASCI